MKILSRRFPSKIAAVLCATLAISLASAVLRAQTVNGPTVNSSGFMPPDAAQASNIVNKYFMYPNFDLWDRANWTSPKPEVAPIVAWITSHQSVTQGQYVVKDKYKGVKDFVGTPDYTWKTENISDPDVMGALTRMGLRVDIREGGGYYIVVAPEKVLADKTRKVPILYVPYVLDKKDVFWAMNTLVHFRKYNELCAQRGDFIIVYVTMEKSAAGRGGVSDAIIDQAYDEYHGDYKQIDLDMSVFKENGAKVSDVPGLDWTSDNGTKLDPDAEITHLGFIPVLNVAGKWGSKPTPGIGLARMHTGNLRFDPQPIIHGILGERIIEGASFVHDHGKDDDPTIKAYFDKMGLVGGAHYYHGERWVMYSPRAAVEQGKKLPLVLVLSEVYPYHEYSISSAYASYLGYFKLAAEGDINVMFFARETPKTMDAAYDIIKEAEKTYPIDPSRIYVTGHSHNGHLSREFAYDHPDMVAAVATLGNSSGLAATAYSHEAVVATDARIKAWSKIDMPVIDIGSVFEVTSPHTMPSSILNDYNLFIDAWQRRLFASRCPSKTREEIMAAEHSDDYVTRFFGLPNDGSSLQMIDGVEHYIIDIKNVDGRKHLRIVGVYNMIHMAEPTMPMVSWTFMRRFARDQKTGKVIELY